MIVDITNCARCGLSHPALVFKKFTNRPLRHTHFALCPTNQEPILLFSVTEETEDTEETEG